MVLATGVDTDVLCLSETHFVSYFTLLFVERLLIESRENLYSKGSITTEVVHYVYCNTIKANMLFS